MGLKVNLKKFFIVSVEIPIKTSKKSASIYIAVSKILIIKLPKYAYTQARVPAINGNLQSRPLPNLCIAKPTKKPIKTENHGKTLLKDKDNNDQKKQFNIATILALKKPLKID